MRLDLTFLLYSCIASSLFIFWIWELLHKADSVVDSVGMAGLLLLFLLYILLSSKIRWVGPSAC